KVSAMKVAPVAAVDPVRSYTCSGTAITRSQVPSTEASCPNQSRLKSELSKSASTVQACHRSPPSKLPDEDSSLKRDVDRADARARSGGRRRSACPGHS